jgi:hypothetical protein
MAIAEKFQGEPPAGLTDKVEYLSSVIPLPPIEEDLLGLPRNPVVSREPRESQHTRRGTTNLEIFTLENGRHYEVVTATPNRQRSEIGVLIGTALGTSIRGHNWHTMNDMMELGYPVVLVGPEGGHAKWPSNPAGLRRFVHNLLSIDLGETAGNMHEILEEVDEDDLYTAGHIIKVGESRDAGVAMGFNARAEQFDRKVVYTDAIAPCFPQPKPLAANAELVLRASEIATQIGSLGKNSPLTNLRRLAHYPKTINLNPHFLLHVAATVPTLVSGAAGHLAKQISPDAKIHNTHFEQDPWSDPDGWDEIFGDNYPYVVNDRRPGDHGAIAKEETQENRLLRLRGLLEELEVSRHDIDRITWQNVHMGER